MLDTKGKLERSTIRSASACRRSRARSCWRTRATARRSRRAFVSRDDVAPGTFLAAVGADNPEKQELEPALDAGVMTRDQVHAELGDVVAGRRPGRTRDDEVTIFDSSGTALQDVAAAIAAYEKARTTGRDTEVKLDG